MTLGLVTRMTSGDMARPPVAAAAVMTPSNQQTALWCQTPKTVFAVRLDGVDRCCLESSMLLSQNNQPDGFFQGCDVAKRPAGDPVANS
jgi:hypothetical protein